MSIAADGDALRVLVTPALLGFVWLATAPPTVGLIGVFWKLSCAGGILLSFLSYQVGSFVAVQMVSWMLYLSGSAFWMKEVFFLSVKLMVNKDMLAC